MGFNYAKEKRRFDAEWRELEKHYHRAGFGKTGITAMRDFDWELFKQRRTYENREQAFPTEVIDNSRDDKNSGLLQKFPALSIGFDEHSFLGRYSWIDAVSDPVLSDKLSLLTDTDKELLTLFVFDGYTQTEIAKMRGCSKVAICQKINRLRLTLK